MTTSYRHLRYRRADGIVTVMLDRPERLNAFTIGQARELVDAFDRADGDDTVRVVILTGASLAFYAGADLSQGASTFDYDGDAASRAASWSAGEIDGAPAGGSRGLAPAWPEADARTRSRSQPLLRPARRGANVTARRDCGFRAGRRGMPGSRSPRPMQPGRPREAGTAERGPADGITRPLPPWSTAHRGDMMWPSASPARLSGSCGFARVVGESADRAALGCGRDTDKWSAWTPPPRRPQPGGQRSRRA
ncbi:enoyl-CoA hydratase-related protein [Streptomyces adustus]|uniref:enoyl-CoA hydratase-related protein n=1 Tax=Streptomyces adustus TaxID=1609272 RepID=UPI003714D049